MRLPAIVNLDGFLLSFTREPVDAARTPEAARRASSARSTPAASRFRASRPISQAVAVLGGGPYSYFRYEMHRAAEGALVGVGRDRGDFEQRFGRRYDAVERLPRRRRRGACSS